ncbi:MAG TPA: MmcQ/YjbR family DNA-binding protein [Pyrinomonadaceae bacterium]|nr:MmcQ/YjbR family DNA-binding protein [Pyrinomonadaceae bacterium]
MKTKHSATPVTFDTVRQIAQTLPGAEEGTSYRTPAFKVKGKLFVRLHQDGDAIVIKVDFDEREELMNADPEKFYITDHYLNYPWMLVRLSRVRPDQLSDLLIGSWRRAASKQLAATFHGFGAS